MSNYYDLLGVSKSATDDEIRKAYRDLGKKYHPDVNKDPEAAEKFKDITQAYNILSNADKKRQYDNPNPMPDFNFIEDLFGGVFNFGFNHQKFRNSSIEIVVPYQLKDFLFEKEISIRYTRRKTCEKCKKIESNCSFCNSGTIYEDIEKNIKIPIGVNAAPYILKNEGNQEFLEYPPGDVIIKPFLELDFECKIAGPNIILKQEIDPILFLLGGELKIKSPLDEDIEIKLDKNGLKNEAYTIKNKGLPVSVGNAEKRGYMAIFFDPTFPSDLTQEQIKILEKYSKSRGYKNIDEGQK